MQEKKATVTVQNLPPVWGDATALEQVFANLFGNALAYLLSPPQPTLKPSERETKEPKKDATTTHSGDGL